MAKIDTLYLIDDDDIFQFLAKKIIEKSQLVNQVLIFSNGFHAIEFLKTARKIKLPEIILLDLNMPVMDGWEFIEEYIKILPNFGKKITLYIVSSSTNPSDIERSQKIREVSNYIIKPLTQDKLVGLLKEHSN